jgi:ribosomal protein S18 acetylase RimI-like enzyme
VAGWTFLADPPGVPGLTFRGFRGDEDFPHMVRILNAACAADGIERFERVEDVRRNYETLDNCDPYADMVFAEIDGDPVAYGRALWWEEIGGTRRYMPFCFMHPEGRGRGIGTAMLAHNEARLRQIAADHPEEMEKTFEVYHAETEVAAQALYESVGYEPHLYEADMLRPDLEGIPEAPMPEGLVVRTPTESEMRQVYEAGVEAFRDHVGAVEPTENDYQRFLDFPWNDPELWRVAWDGDEVAGQVRSFIDEKHNEEFGRKRGWTEFISVRRPYRRRGLARSLLVQSLHAVKERGMEEAALGVLTSNPLGAFDLYRSVGFEVARLWTSRYKPLE